MPVQYKGVHGGCIDKHGNFHVTCKMTTKKPRTFTHGRKDYTFEKGDARYFYTDDIGKTIFMERKAAEKAMENIVT